MSVLLFFVVNIFFLTDKRFGVEIFNADGFGIVTGCVEYGRVSHVDNGEVEITFTFRSAAWSQSRRSGFALDVMVMIWLDGVI